MKKFNILTKILAIVLVATWQMSCNNDTGDSVPVVVQSTSVTDVSYTSVTVRGDILQGSPSERGICWSSSSTQPTMEDSKKAAGSGSGIFSVEIDGLAEGTTYYFRAYAIQEGKPVYGGLDKCRTYEKGKPGVAITSASDLTMDGFTCHVRVISDGGQEITDCGVCWTDNGHETPDIEGSHKSGGSGTGAFQIPVTDLNPDVDYFVRPYVVYSGGTVYGEIVEIYTTPVIRNIKLTNVNPTADAAKITIVTQFTDQAKVTEQGIVYGFADEPTVEDGTTVKANKTTAGTFTFDVAELEHLSYFVRAYIKTEKYGVFYSDVEAFTTLVPFEYYLGDYTLHYSTSSTTTTPNKRWDVKLVKGDEANTYYLRDLLKDTYQALGEIQLSYDPKTSDLVFSCRNMGKDANKYDIWARAYSLLNGTSSAYTGTSNTYAVKSENFRKENDHLMFDLVDFNTWSGYTMIGFTFRLYEGTTNKTGSNTLLQTGNNNCFYMTFEKK